MKLPNISSKISLFLPTYCIIQILCLSLYQQIRYLLTTNNIKTMARKIELTTNESNVLLKVTHRAKMDWFDIDNQNRCRDLENNNRVISTRNAVNTIIEGLTDYDLSILNYEEMLTLLNLATRI